MLSERRDDGFLLTTDAGRLDHELVHEWISGTYWATGRSAEAMSRAIAGSQPVGVYREADGRQVALLATRDAQPVYAPLGFTPVDGQRWMECDLEAAAARLAW